MATKSFTTFAAGEAESDFTAREAAIHMILEAVVTTVSQNGELNVAPMGPEFAADGDHFELRPFEDSKTFQNLRDTAAGVLHVTDDVLLITQSALNRLDVSPETEPAAVVAGQVLQNCCRWYEFQCQEKPSSGSRKAFHCDIVATGRRRDFFGFNRAKHAVLEATIAATRIHFLPLEHITQQLQRAFELVERTGGESEQAACQVLQDYLNQHQD